MKNNIYTQSVSILLGLGFVFFIQISFLSTYSSYLLAILIIFASIYITLRKRSKTSSELFTGSPLELFGIVAIITLIVSLTGGIDSPLFFFVYFLLFLLAFMSSTLSVWVFAFAIILFFLPQISSTFDTNTVIKVGSIILLSPIAYFVANELQRRELLRGEIEAKTDDIIQEAEAIKETTNPSAEESEAIDEIIEEASSLREDAEK